MKTLISITLLFIGLILSITSYSIPLTLNAEPPSMASTALLGRTAWNLYIDGEFSSDSPDIIEKELKRLSQFGVSVYLNSPGGDLLGGIKIGKLIRKYAIDTSIGRKYLNNKKVQPGVCFSSCALAYLGGYFRYISLDSKYGVHRFSKETKPSDTDLDTAQIIAASINNYLREMDIDTGLYELMSVAGKDQIYILNPDELENLNVVNNGRNKSDWTLEVIEGGIYLKGVQRTRYGIGKLLFACDITKKEINLLSMYSFDSEIAKDVIENNWIHTLMISGGQFAINTPIDKVMNGDYLSISPIKLSNQQVQNLSKAISIGHAMQRGSDSPVFYGYTIDIDPIKLNFINTFINNCTNAK